MSAFLKSKTGMISAVVFVLLMAVVFHRVSSKPTGREPKPAPTVVPVRPESPARTVVPNEVPPAPAAPKHIEMAKVAENAAYLESYYGLGRNAQVSRDRLGTSITRRQSASGVSESTVPDQPEPAAVSGPVPARASLRLEGSAPARGVAAPVSEHASSVATAAEPRLAATASSVEPNTAPAAAARPLKGPSAPRSRPARFNPYGRIIKCELVFTIDSTNEQTPVIALIVEPVYNNGALVIPAGAELHGAVRPDRLRDRLFSNEDWVLVFPREYDRPNGRQLAVKGVALNRVEPDVNGMTWGITDGSLGLEGTVIRTLQQEEIKRFAATFLASAALTLQDRQSDRSGQQSVRNTPQNAALQGLSASFQRVVEDITAEIEKHGVFVRVPAGHQFYFYPTQIIDPDVADVSTDIATVQ